VGSRAQQPWIDLPQCATLAARGVFGPHGGRALQLHQQGYCLFRPNDPDWLPLIDLVRFQLEPLVDLREWQTGADARIRIPDAWKQPGAAAVKTLALQPELLDLLQACYGRKPFVFQTLNFPVGSNQAVHSDATHFHCEPEGFMCGMWIALEDVTPEAGPLVYYPGSHRLPYVKAGDLGLSPQQVQAEEHKQRLFEPYWQHQIRAYGFEQQMLLARKGDVLIWHANLLHGGLKVQNHQATRWSQVVHVLFEGCRFTAPMQSFGSGRPCYRPRHDLATGERRPNGRDRLLALLPTQTLPEVPKAKPPLDLSGQPLIDRLDFDALVQDGSFGPFQSLAMALNAEGFGLLQIEDSQWLPLLDEVRQQLAPQVDLQRLEAGNLEPVRFQDAWLHPGIEVVRQVACHPEILAALQVLYGRRPFPFQTLNFPNGTAQHYHSDAVHFHALPHGFMCGVWVALEDISAESGPLVYFPGSHRLPYLAARDLGLFHADVKAQPAPQVLFESYWRDQVKQQGYPRRYFTPRKGDVLIWHANLLHGGSAVKNRRLSRWSQVSHYYFHGCAHTTPLWQTVDAPSDGDQWRHQPLDLTQQ